ncbi:MAG TPA: ABC transporter substrate-binding protein [Gemmatimonadaceae bacterium]|nr:ABC transporter substrate-binding protein [Gemmatimonadaceae bacterium]
MKGLRLLAIGCVLSACRRDSAMYTIASAAPSNEAYGVMSRQGTELAVDAINKRGGIRSHRLALVRVDDDGTGTRAAAVAQELVDADSILAVVGHANSSATVAAARVYDGQLAAVSPSASTPEITGLSPWLFRVIPSDSVNGQDLARFATSLGHERAAILYENNSYGRGLADAFRRAFRGDVTSLEPVAVDGKEVEPYLAWLRAHDPGLIFVAGSDGSGLEILREARRLGIQSVFLGGDGWAGITNDSAASEGVYVGAPFSAENPRRDVQDFVRAFRAKFGRDPNSFAALAYDATMVIAQAIEAVGPDRRAIRDYLGSMRDGRPYEGITGQIAFQPSGDVAGKPMAMTRVRRGALVLQGGGDQ